ncbi:MAG: merR1 [Phycisphaerales bacterium]|nr:merR1 [Phycisphaerales bacterium]
MREVVIKPLTIGQLAHRAGVGVETIRFYEREGLLAEPQRRASGYRQYGEDVVARLRFIRRAKELGFTLKEVAELLSLRLDPDTTPADVKRRAEAKLADIEAKVRTLRRMHKALSKVTAACGGHGKIGDCPILDALEREADPCAHEEHEESGRGDAGADATSRKGTPGVSPGEQRKARDRRAGKDNVMEKVKLDVRGMSCGGCVRHVTQALAAVPGTCVGEVKIGLATVEIDPQATSREALFAAVRKAGFEASEAVAPA